MQDCVLFDETVTACGRRFGHATLNSVALLTEGGHVSGTAITHPAKSRKSYWFNGPKTTDADAWKEGAEKHQGSWWPEWCRWLAKTSGKQVARRKQLGSPEWSPLEGAPGSYVLEQVPQG